MKGIRLLGCLVLVSIAVPGCSSASPTAAPAARAQAARSEEASKAAGAQRQLDAAKDLAAAKRYDEAIAQDLALAGKLEDPDLVRRALAAAAQADTDKIDGKDFPTQVASVIAFYRQVPSADTTSQIVTSHVKNVLLDYAQLYTTIASRMVDDRERYVKDLRAGRQGRRKGYMRALENPPASAQQLGNVAASLPALGEPQLRPLFLDLAGLAPAMAAYAETDAELDRTHTSTARTLTRIDQANKLLRAKLPAAEKAMKAAL